MIIILSMIKQKLFILYKYVLWNRFSLLIKHLIVDIQILLEGIRNLIYILSQEIVDISNFNYKIIMI